MVEGNVHETYQLTLRLLLHHRHDSRVGNRTKPEVTRDKFRIGSTVGVTGGEIEGELAFIWRSDMSGGRHDRHAKDSTTLRPCLFVLFEGSRLGGVWSDIRRQGGLHSRPDARKHPNDPLELLSPPTDLPAILRRVHQL